MATWWELHRRPTARPRRNRLTFDHGIVHAYGIYGPAWAQDPGLGLVDETGPCPDCMIAAGPDIPDPLTSS